MEFNKRKSVCDKLAKYDTLANENDFIEITEWTNGEGWDINIYSKNNEKLFSLTWGELEAIKHLINSLNYNEEV